MAGGYLSVEREFELAQVTRFSPATQQRPDSVGLYDRPIQLCTHTSGRYQPATGPTITSKVMARAYGIGAIKY